MSGASPLADEATAVAEADGAGPPRRLVVLLHAGYWIGYVAVVAAVVAIVLARTGGGAEARAALGRALVTTLVVPNVLAFYGSHAGAFRWLRVPGRGGALAAAVVGLAVAAGAMGVALLYAAAGAPAVRRAELPGLAALLLCLAALAAAHAGMALALRGFLAWLAALRARTAHERRVHALELALVRARLDPHFLFNTLNNIDVLIGCDPDAASTYLQQLSALMRYVLFDAAAATVPLAAELAQIERYLALERLRHRDPGFVTLDVSGSPEGVRVPPTLFLPFLENAFTHGAPEAAGGHVRVSCRVDQRGVTFACENRVVADAGATSAGGGLGHALARRRLELLYPGHHALRLTHDAERFVVTLTLPAVPPPAGPASRVA